MLFCLAETWHLEFEHMRWLGGKHAIALEKIHAIAEG